MTQTVVSGYFTITLAVRIGAGDPGAAALVDALHRQLGPDAAVNLMSFREASAGTNSSDRYILTAVGEPGTAIVHEIAALVADPRRELRGL